jgi:hypothetical protein
MKPESNRFKNLKSKWSLELGNIVIGGLFKFNFKCLVKLN